MLQLGWIRLLRRPQLSRQRSMIIRLILAIGQLWSQEILELSDTFWKGLYHPKFYLHFRTEPDRPCSDVNRATYPRLMRPESRLNCKLLNVILIVHLHFTHLHRNNARPYVQFFNSTKPDASHLLSQMIENHKKTNTD